MNAAAASSPREFRLGSLLYSRAGLFALFGWLLWGDFCFTLMETVWSSVMPLHLRKFEASNTVISLALVTIPQLLNFVLNPIISTVSDRFRSRFGRRIPFLLFATPFVTGFLILMSFSRQIGETLSRWLGAGHDGWIGPESLIVAVIFAIVVGFRFFELFISTVYFYLFNDVVPEQLLGRFLGLFRVVGTGAGALFNFFVLTYAESHTSEIFLGAALLYGLSFSLMCLKVKEGTYEPPPPMTDDKRRSVIGYVKSYVKTCFSHRIYFLISLSFALATVGTCVAAFNVFLVKSLGLTLDQFGKVAAVSGIVSAVLAYPVGSLVDRFHPVRVMLYARIGMLIATACWAIFLFFDFVPKTTFWIFVGINIVGIPMSAVFNAAGIPLLMRCFPRAQYGQFCSAWAMFVSLSMVIGSAAAGGFLDLMKAAHHGSDYFYRYVPMWTLVFYVASLFATWLLYREWLKLGGDQYSPPGEDKSHGGEQQPLLTSNPPVPRQNAAAEIS